MTEHRSRFKAYLIPAEQLPAEAQTLRPYLEELKKEYLAKNLSAAEYATLFVLLYLNARSPQWWMKKSHDWELAGENDQFLSYWLRHFQIKKLPESVSRCLYFWIKGTYAITLKDHFITPYEMLAYQARGERVATLALDKALRGELVDGQRDAVEFLLHDLVHADLFFSSLQLWSEQKSFFQSLQRLVEQGFLAEEQDSDPQFQQDFHYLISDMNSHPAHLASMFKASYIKHLLHREGKTITESLSSSGLEQLSAQVHLWQSVGQFEFSLQNV